VGGEMTPVNQQYQKAVENACAELAEMMAPTASWEAHAAVIVTKNLTPLFRDMRDDVKRVDWLDRHGPEIHLKAQMRGVVSANPGHLRECIDEAMRDD
jgi:hypothetical protein